MQENSGSAQLRLRVFAGPNGSGKSTVIKSVRDVMPEGNPIDFGIYINADDIASALKTNTFTLNAYEIKAIKDDVLIFAKE